MKKQLKRISAAALALAVSASVLVGVSVKAAPEIEIANYPALRGFSSGSAPAENQWSFGVADYGMKSPLTPSTDGFAAPKAKWSANDTQAVLSWDEYNGADTYVINFYLNSVLSFTKELKGTSYTSTSAQDEVKGGEIYEVQVLAKNVAGDTIAASDVRRFPTNEDANSLRTLENFKAATNDIFALKYQIDSCKITENHSAQINPKNRKASEYTQVGMKINAEDTTGRAEALVLKVKHAAGTVCSVGVEFGVSAATTGKSSGNTYKKTTTTKNWNSKDEETEITFVSIKDPSQKLTIKSKPTYGYTYNAEYAEKLAAFTDGYYMIIPLSAYDTSVRNDLKAGTFDLLGLKLQREYTTDENGKFKNTGFIKGESQVEILSVGLCDNIKSFVYELENGYDSTYSFKDGAVTTVLPTVFDKSTDSMYCVAAATGYKLYNSAAQREVRFTARSYRTAFYGAYLSFTAPEKGFYDLTAALRVVNNSTARGELYYRLTKITDDGDTQETLYPDGDTQWECIEISDSNANPEAELALPVAELLKGDGLVLEAYFKSSGDDADIELSLGNPTVNLVTRTDNYKGESTEWSFGNYVPHFIYGGSVSNLNTMHGRWSASALQISNNGTAVTLPLDNYTNDFVKNTATGVGYRYYTATDRTEEMKAVIGKNYGLSFDFASPVDGNITLSAAFGTDSTVKYRIVKNGEVVYPENGGWQLSANEASLYTQIAANNGDKISLQMYSEADTIREYSFTAAPAAALSFVSSSANAATDTTYAPLWERPWRGREYEGDFKEYTGSLWNFNTIAVGSADNKVTVYNADYYSTKNNTLSATAAAVKGSFYRFDTDELAFCSAARKDGYNGMSLTFNVPTAANYDISSKIRVIDGSGSVYIRVLHERNAETAQLYPEDGWGITEVSAGDIIDFSPIEIKASAGEKITLQVYARANGDTPVTLGFGQLAVQRLNNKFFTATVYNPADYAVFEPKYDGSASFGSGRFEYSVTDKDGNEHFVTRSSDTQKAYFTDDGSGITFANGTFGLKLNSGETARVMFNAPVAGGATVNIKPNGTAQLRLLHNDTVISDWASELTNIAVTAAAGDKFTVEVRGCEDLSFEAFGFEITGRNNNQGTATDTAYYSVFGEPYDEEYADYKGKYTEDVLSYWRYYLYDIKAANTVKTDYYDAAEHKLLLKNASGPGYSFTTHNLLADINGQYGISLGFTAPRSDVFNFRTGLVINTNNATATLKARLISISATDGVVTTVWPTDGDWYEKSVSTGEEISVPYAEFNLKQGDTVRFEAYAVSLGEESLQINLVSPAIVQDTVTTLSSGECTARIFYASKYSPYKYFKKYSGSYTAMKNRWNFEFFNADGDLSSTETLQPTFFSTGNYNELIYKASSAWPSYKFTDKNLATYPAREKGTNKSFGTSAQFVSPIEGSIALTGAPALKTVMPVEGSGVAFRIRLIKAESGEVTTVWPANGDEWEKLNNNNKLSALQDVTVDVNAGDEVRFETYVYADDEDAMSEYTATNNLKVSIDMTAAVIVYDSIETQKTNWSAMGGFMADLQISPLWKIQYTNSSVNPVWKTATRFSWNYWLSNENAYMGISGGCRMWICNSNGGLDDFDTPAVAYAYYPQSDGWLIMGASNKCTLQTVKSASETQTGLVRITVNGENFYPAGGGWIDAKSASVGKLEIEVKKGDVVRFEMTTSEHLASGDEVYVHWNPSFTYQKYKNVYTETDDIFNMLDRDMLEYFSVLSGKTGFDTDPEGGKALSDAAVARKLQALLDAMNGESSNSGNNGSTNGSTKGEETVYIPGTYEEWTEEIYTPGGGYRKIIRKYYTEWWVYALIIGGAVLAVGGITVTLIILKKKGKLFSKKTDRLKITGGS